MAIYRIGDLVTFDYSKGKHIHDRNPQVLVLHDNWTRTVHGLNFNYLSQQEINYIKAILNPAFEADIVKKDARIAHQMTRVQHILNNLAITSPHDFYLRFVRGFIQPRGWDPYRRYSPSSVMNPRIVTRREVLVGDHKDSMFNRFIQKFQHARGPQMALPGQTKKPTGLGDL